MEWGFFEKLLFLLSIFVFGFVCFLLFSIVEKIILNILEASNNSIYALLGIIGVFIDGMLFYIWNERRLGRW